MLVAMTAPRPNAVTSAKINIAREIVNRSFMASAPAREKSARQK
jgi:hypothetical protein